MFSFKPGMFNLTAVMSNFKANVFNFKKGIS